METYVLDKTFLSIGSIGTGVAVRLGASSPGASKYRNYVKQIAGSIIGGSIPVAGISITGCSVTGKLVIIRMLGIAKGKLRTTQGSIIQGQPMRVGTGGKLQAAGGNLGAGTVAIVGKCVYAEGGGSLNSFIDVFVNPSYI